MCNLEVHAVVRSRVLSTLSKVISIAKPYSRLLSREGLIEAAGSNPGGMQLLGSCSKPQSPKPGTQAVAFFL